MTSAADAPLSDDLSLLGALASDLRDLRYSVDGVEGLLGPAAYEALARDQLVPALLASGGPGELTEESARGLPGLAVIVRLWLLAQSVPVAAVEAALPSLGVRGLVLLGLAAPDGNGQLRALTDLRPYAWEGAEGAVELWVASDLGAHQTEGVLRKDHVLGIGQASTTLVQTTVRRRVSRALDVGTGCGVQAFHLLQHAEHVVATDLSARALAFARFNLLLNASALGLDPSDPGRRIELRQGSLLEPVRGERFDLIVSNPPFVITPRVDGESEGEQFTYRDGGLPGDQLVSSLLTALPEVLEPGGTAQLLGNWEIQEGLEWEGRVRSWIPDEADAWVLQREVLTPDRYAETWLQDASQGRDPFGHAASYAAYLSDFASRGVSGVGFGMVWMRRPTEGQARLGRFEELLHPLEQPLGPYWQDFVSRADWLASIGGPRCLGAWHLIVADDVTEERHQRPGAEHPGVILLRQGAGFRRTTLLSTELAGFVSACDGELSAGQIAGAVAALLGRGGPGLDEGFREALLHEVARLVLEGFLLKA